MVFMAKNACGCYIYLRGHLCDSLDFFRVELHAFLLKIVPQKVICFI